MRKIIILFLAPLFFVLSALAQNQSSMNIKDNSIVVPESMNEQLGKLLHDWQLDLSKSDAQCTHGSNVVFHDSVYARRLYNLPTLMELSYNQVVKSYIEMYANRRREMVSYMLTIGSYYFPMFEQALDKYALPLELKYLPVIESALNPVAVSRVGATGLWQFMLRTGQGYGLEVNSLVDERRDPYKSTEAAVRYLKDLFAIYGDWNLVIAAYNCGPGNVNKAIARSGGKRDYWEIYNYLPRETRGYVPAFIAANYIMNFYDEHNICPVSYGNGAMNALDTVQVSEQIHFSQISQVLDIPMSEIQRWNPQFRKNIVPGNFKSYALVLPTNKILSFIERKDSISNFRKDEYLTHRVSTDIYLGNNLSDADSKNVYYKVRKGDNLGAIARKNGVTVAQIKSWNGLRSSKIAVGKQLIVKKQRVKTVSPENTAELVAQTSSDTDTSLQTPRSVNEYYRVRKGDNLGKIAKNHGITLTQLKSWNNLTSNNISVGKKLIVKKRTVEVEATPAPADVSESREEPQVSSSVISGYINRQLGDSTVVTR